MRLHAPALPCTVRMQPSLCLPSTPAMQVTGMPGVFFWCAGSLHQTPWPTATHLPLIISACGLNIQNASSFFTPLSTGTACGTGGQWGKLGVGKGKAGIRWSTRPFRPWHRPWAIGLRVSNCTCAFFTKHGTHVARKGPCHGYSPPCHAMDAVSPAEAQTHTASSATDHTAMSWACCSRGSP